MNNIKLFIKSLFNIQEADYLNFKNKLNNMLSDNDVIQFTKYLLSHIKEIDSELNKIDINCMLFNFIKDSFIYSVSNIDELNSDFIDYLVDSICVECNYFLSDIIINMTDDEFETYKDELNIYKKRIKFFDIIFY